MKDKTIALGIIGTGLIGKALLNEMVFKQEEFKAKLQINICVRGIMSSQTMLLGEKIELSTWSTQPQIASDLQQFATHLLKSQASATIIIDCTASEHIAQEYLHFLEQGIHIVTPNKKANAGDLTYYKKIKQCAAANHLHCLYEATVGAGLPIIKTLQDLILSGDRILRLEGILSGTLQYIFSQLSKGDNFSDIVRNAKQQGFTEPDPRQDLSGMDVARKLVCLAREIGFDAKIEDVSVQNLIPPEVSTCSVDDFFQLLPQCDEHMHQVSSMAQAKSETLRYIGAIDMNGQMNVSMRTYPITHPYSTLAPKNNLFMFYTERYVQEPLIIQGPVLGEQLTIAAILADLLHIIKFTGTCHPLKNCVSNIPISGLRYH